MKTYDEKKHPRDPKTKQFIDKPKPGEEAPGDGNPMASGAVDAEAVETTTVGQDNSVSSENHTKRNMETVFINLVSHEELAEAMDFDHVITVYPNGTIGDSKYYAPEVWQELDKDGQAIKEPELFSSNWTLLTGYTGQYGYNGAVMHQSEYIGGRLADHILKNPGHYVVLVVEGEGPDYDPEVGERDLVGWVVAYREAD